MFLSRLEALHQPYHNLVTIASNDWYNVFRDLIVSSGFLNNIREFFGDMK